MEAVRDGDVEKMSLENTRDAEKIVPGKISIRCEPMLMLLSTLLLRTIDIIPTLASLYFFVINFYVKYGLKEFSY